MSSTGSKTGTLYLVVPQLPSSSGWTECPQHQAKRFAVLRRFTWRARGRLCSSTRFVAARPSLSEAELLRSQLQAGKQPLSSDVPALGQRFPKRNRALIAKGIGRNPEVLS